MSVTILETLQNAEFNLEKKNLVSVTIAKEQLHNAVTLLEKGYDLYEKVDPFLQKYYPIESVPEKDDD